MNEQPLLFLMSFLRVYGFILMARAISSWLPSLHGSRLSAILYMLTEPYVSLFRFKRSALGALDLSFLLAYMFLTLLLSILEQIARTGGFSIVSILILLLNMAASVINFLLLVYAIMVIVRLIAYKSLSPRSIQMNYTLDRFLAPFTQQLKNKLGRNKLISHRKQLWYLLVIIVISSLVFTALWRLIIFGIIVLLR